MGEPRKNDELTRKTGMNQLKRYLIERDIPGVGGMSILELCGAARASNRAIEQIGTSAIQCASHGWPDR